MWMNAALVGAGGFAGAVLRYYLSKKMAERFQTDVPYGTLTINLTGSLLLGLLIGANPGSAVLLMAGTGFMGAFTTFSTLKLESVTLAEKSLFGAFIGYLGATYTLGILLAYAGYCIGRAL